MQSSRTVGTYRVGNVKGSNPRGTSQTRISLAFLNAWTLNRWFPNTNSDLGSRLTAHGLTGESLQLKKYGWLSRLFPFGRKLDRARVGKILGWGEILYGSTVDCLLDGKIGAAAKEFVQIARHYVESKRD